MKRTSGVTALLKEEKIYLMTRLSLYEKKEGKKTIPIGKYFRKDYIALKMLQTAFVVALAYFCILGLWILGKLEELLEGLNDLNLVRLAVLFVLGFVLLEVGFLIAARFIYKRKYTEAKKSLKLYYQDLKQLSRYY